MCRLTLEFGGVYEIQGGAAAGLVGGTGRTKGARTEREGVTKKDRKIR